MAFSLTKRVQSKSNLVSNGNDDSKALGEVLHRSTKAKQKKKKHKQLLIPQQQILSPDSDVDTNIPSLSNENSIIYRNQCSCETHYDKELFESSYNLTVDKLFDLMFGSNEFVRTYRKAQNFYDETATEWTINESTTYRERVLKYKVPYESTFIGKGTIHTREQQTLFVEVPGSHYTLETDLYSEGVKFSDTFSLIMRYCLVQTSLTTTNLCVRAQIIYNRSVNGFLQKMIERNAYSASQEGLKDLNNRLNLIANFKMKKRHSIKDEITLIVPTTTVENIRRMSHENVLPNHQTFSEDNNRHTQSSDADKIMHILIFLVVILFFIHISLYMKLTHTNLLLDKFTHLLDM